MTTETKRPAEPTISHRFLDEAGDTTFFGKGRSLILGQPGVSHSFCIGMVKFKGDLPALRQQVVDLQQSIVADDYLKAIPSIVKKQQKGGYFFHATDDPPEVREKFFRFIKSLDCTLEMVVGRKIPELFAKKHNHHESEFYADLLSHLLKNKLKTADKLVLNIAERGPSTKNTNLQRALEKANERYAKKWDHADARCRVVFNVQNHRTEPLLNCCRLHVLGGPPGLRTRGNALLSISTRPDQVGRRPLRRGQIRWQQELLYTSSSALSRK